MSNPPFQLNITNGSQIQQDNITYGYQKPLPNSPSHLRTSGTAPNYINGIRFHLPYINSSPYLNTYYPPYQSQGTQPNPLSMYSIPNSGGSSVQSAQFTFQASRTLPSTPTNANSQVPGDDCRPQKRARIDREHLDPDASDSVSLPKKRQHIRRKISESPNTTPNASAPEWPWIGPKEGVDIHCQLRNCPRSNHGFTSMDEMELHLRTSTDPRIEFPGHAMSPTHTKREGDVPVQCSWGNCAETALPSGMIRHIQARHLHDLIDKCGKCGQAVLPRNKNSSGHFSKCGAASRARRAPALKKSSET